MQPSRIHFQNDHFTLIHDDVLNTRLVQDESVDLVVTSPPYNVDINYNSHKDDISYAEYLEFSQKWMRCCHAWLKDDGRFCLNIPLDKNKGGQQSVGADLTTIAKKIGFQYLAKNCLGLVEERLSPVRDRARRIDRRTV